MKHLRVFFALFLSLSTSSGALAADDAWWKAFEDPQLDDLIEKAQAANPNLRTARLRYALSEANTWVSFTPMLPTLQAVGSANLAPTAGLGFGLPFSFGGPGTSFGPVALDDQFSSVGTDRPPDVFVGGSAQVQARWLLDPGVSYFRYAASQQDALATQKDRDEQALALSRQVAQTYFDLLAATQQTEIVKRQMAAQKNLLTVVELRFAQGDATSVDVLQQRQQVESAKAQFFPAQSQILALEQQLKALLALERDDTLDLNYEQGLPAFPEEIEIDLEEALDDRPDLKAARVRVSAAAARTTSAFLAFFPTLTLSAQVGPQYQYITEFKNQWNWGMGATLTIPLFNGQTFANYRASQVSEALAEETVHALEVNAAQEVDTALAQEQQLRLQIAATKAQVEAAKAAVVAARERYLAGLLNYQNVLLAENTHFMSTLTALELHRRLISTHLTLTDAAAGKFADGLGEESTGSTP